MTCTTQAHEFEDPVPEEPGQACAKPFSLVAALIMPPRAPDLSPGDKDMPENVAARFAELTATRSAWIIKRQHSTRGAAFNLEEDSC
jgi:hypothetical protein